MFEPLNIILYESLQEAFGRVRVTNEGETIRLSYSPDWQHRKGRLAAKVVSSGETYYVNCPFCSDTRQRLGISYHWSVDEEQTWDDMLYLANCFNEKCISSRQIQKELHALVYPDGLYGSTMKVRLPPPRPSPASPSPKRIVLPTGTPLAELPGDHLTLEYLRGRKFDPAWLAKSWGVYYCETNREQSGQENTPRPCFHTPRIVYPVFALPTLFGEQNGASEKGVRLAGWQARAVDDVLAGGLPKYFTAAGMKKSELLYGLPRAIKTEGPVVLVEGAIDVWRLRTNAVALFGKTISPSQIKLLLRHFHGRPIVVLLDADAVDNARRVCQQIRSSRNCGGDEAPVVIGKLPAGRKDPGDCTYKEVWNVVDKAMKQYTVRKNGRGDQYGT